MLCKLVLVVYSLFIYRLHGSDKMQISQRHPQIKRHYEGTRWMEQWHKHHMYDMSGKCIQSEHPIPTRTPEDLVKQYLMAYGKRISDRKFIQI